jgi:hypothetical protein
MNKRQLLIWGAIIATAVIFFRFVPVGQLMWSNFKPYRHIRSNLTPDGVVYMPIQGGDLGSGITPLFGELVMEDGCLRVNALRNDKTYTLIWEAYVRLRYADDGTFYLIDERGEVVGREGELIAMGGIGYGRTRPLVQMACGADSTFFVAEGPEITPVEVTYQEEASTPYHLIEYQLITWGWDLPEPIELTGEVIIEEGCARFTTEDQGAYTIIDHPSASEPPFEAERLTGRVAVPPYEGKLSAALADICPTGPYLLVDSYSNW